VRCPRAPVSEADLEALVAALERELPGFALRFKSESRLQRLIGFCVRPFNRTYLTEYTTVMFGRVYLPDRACLAEMSREAVYTLLCHEAVHLRDARRFPVFFQLSYLLLPPVGPGFRALWEWRAYRETLRVDYALWGMIPDAQLDRIADRFAGPDYLFMWPFRTGLRARLERLRSEIIGGP
jgi:hypothetical protein